MGRLRSRFTSGAVGSALVFAGFAGLLDLRRPRRPSRLVVSPEKGKLNRPRRRRRGLRSADFPELAAFSSEGEVPLADVPFE